MSNRILKYSYQYLKKINNLNSLSRISLPLGWHEKIREALSKGANYIGEPNDDSETTADEIDVGPISFGSSQESLFSIQRDEESQEASE